MRGLLSGQSLVVMERFDAERVLQHVEQHRVTWMLLVPTMMQRIWRLPEAVRSSYDVSSLEMILHLGAPCPEWLKRAWIDWLGPDRVVELYAGTESQGITVIGGLIFSTLLTLLLVPAYFSIAISIETRLGRVFHRFVGVGAHQGAEPVPAE